MNSALLKEFHILLRIPFCWRNSTSFHEFRFVEGIQHPFTNSVSVRFWHGRTKSQLVLLCLLTLCYNVRPCPSLAWSNKISSRSSIFAQIILLNVRPCPSLAWSNKISIRSSIFALIMLLNVVPCPSLAWSNKISSGSSMFAYIMLHNVRPCRFLAWSNKMKPFFYICAQNATKCSTMSTMV